jgi:hypothetical protein
MFLHHKFFFWFFPPIKKGGEKEKGGKKKSLDGSRKNLAWNKTKVLNEKKKSI